MKAQTERSTFDDCELPDEVDFTGAIRGRFYQPKKVSTTIRLDDILLFFKNAQKRSIFLYHVFINQHLRIYVQQSIRETMAIS